MEHDFAYPQSLMHSTFVSFQELGPVGPLGNAQPPHVVGLLEIETENVICIWRMLMLTNALVPRVKVIQELVAALFLAALVSTSLSYIASK